MIEIIPIRPPIASIRKWRSICVGRKQWQYFLLYPQFIRNDLRRQRIGGLPISENWWYARTQKHDAPGGHQCDQPNPFFHRSRSLFIRCGQFSRQISSKKARILGVGLLPLRFSKLSRDQFFLIQAIRLPASNRSCAASRESHTQANEKASSP